MKNKRKITDDDNPDRWVVSYADFVTLLFAFFTTLYAISHVDAGKLAMFAGSMKSAFQSDYIGSAGPIIEGVIPINPDVVGLEREFAQAVSTLKTNEDIAVRHDERGVVISFGDNVLFDPGQAALIKDAAPALTSIASVIQKIPNNIIIEGHTDNVPINSSKYTSNWELSTARAMSVLNYLLKNYNLASARFSAAGYAEFKPAASNTTPEGRAKNRRVDIIVLSADKKTQI